MKRILAAMFVAVLACSATAMAQTAVAGATKLGTMKVTTAILNGPGIQTRVKKAATGEIISELTVFAGVGGQVTFSISSSTIHSTDDGINQLTTSQVYDLIGAAAVATANSMGYLHCTAGDAATLVSAESCVTRTGSGSSTQFTPANSTDNSTRKYNDVCVSTGGVSIDLLGTYDPGCSGTIH